MAFTVRHLGVLGYVNGFTLWCYNNQTDSLEAVDAPGYFDATVDMFRVGNIIMISLASGSAIRTVASVAPIVTLARLL